MMPLHPHHTKGDRFVHVFIEGMLVWTCRP